MRIKMSTQALCTLKRVCGWCKSGAPKLPASRCPVQDSQYANVSRKIDNDKETFIVYIEGQPTAISRHIDMKTWKEEPSY